jgi:hypothetical protein
LKHSIKRRLQITTAACAVFWQFFGTVGNGGPASVLAIEQPDKVLESLLASVSNWNDYSCIAELHSFKTGKDVPSTCRFFYKKRSQVRIEVTGGGFRDGSVIVRQADSAVKAHGGGLLGRMIMNLDPDSRLLVMANGLNVTKSDFPEILGSCNDLLHKAYTAKGSTTDVPDLGAKAYVIDINDANQQLSRRIYLSADQKTPLRFDYYKDGKLLTTCYFKSLKPNAGLTDELFKL